MKFLKSINVKNDLNDTGEVQWSRVSRPYIKHEGAWAEAINVYKKVDGQWQIVHTGDKIVLSVIVPAGEYESVGTQNLVRSGDGSLKGFNLIEYIADNTVYSLVQLESTPFSITVTIDSGAKITGPLVIKGFDPSSKIRIINKGEIYGLGGQGGSSLMPVNASTINSNDYLNSVKGWSQLDGKKGNDAIRVYNQVSIDNQNGKIYGGGGGGHGGMPVIKLYPGGMAFHCRNQTSGNYSFFVDTVRQDGRFQLSLHMPGGWKPINYSWIGRDGLHVSNTGNPWVGGWRCDAPVTFYTNERAAANLNARVTRVGGFGLLGDNSGSTNIGSIMQNLFPTVDQAIFGAVFHGACGGGGGLLGKAGRSSIKFNLLTPYKVSKVVNNNLSLSVRWTKLLSDIIWESSLSKLHNFMHIRHTSDHATDGTVIGFDENALPLTNAGTLGFGDHKEIIKSGYFFGSLLNAWGVGQRERYPIRRSVSSAVDITNFAIDYETSPRFNFAKTYIVGYETTAEKFGSGSSIDPTGFIGGDISALTGGNGGSVSYNWTPESARWDHPPLRTSKADQIDIGYFPIRTGYPPRALSFGAYYADLYAGNRTSFDKVSFNSGVVHWLNSWKSSGGKGGDAGESGESHTVGSYNVDVRGKVMQLPSITINGGAVGSSIREYGFLGGKVSVLNSGDIKGPIEQEPEPMM